MLTNAPPGVHLEWGITRQDFTYRPRQVMITPVRYARLISYLQIAALMPYKPASRRLAVLPSGAQPHSSLVGAHASLRRCGIPIDTARSSDASIWMFIMWTFSGNTVPRATDSYILLSAANEKRAPTPARAGPEANNLLPSNG